MKRMIKVKTKKVITLLECPAGMFVTKENGILCVKTGYLTDAGGVEAYIVETGEKLSMDGRTMTSDGCKTIEVYPAKIKSVDGR